MLATFVLMRGSRKFCQRESNSDNVFFYFFYEGSQDPNSTKRGPSSAHRVSLAGRCWPNIEYWLGIFVIFQEIWTSIAKKHYIFVIFQGWGSGPPASPSWSANSLPSARIMKSTKPLSNWPSSSAKYIDRNTQCKLGNFRESFNFAKLRIYEVS